MYMQRVRTINISQLKEKHVKRFGYDWQNGNWNMHLVVQRHMVTLFGMFMQNVYYTVNHLLSHLSIKYRSVCGINRVD